MVLSSALHKMRQQQRWLLGQSTLLNWSATSTPELVTASWMEDLRRMLDGQNAWALERRSDGPHSNHRFPGGTTFAALPDLVAMLKRHSSVGMNPRMAAITGTFQILWVTYGVLIGSRNIIMWNVIAIATNYLTVRAYIYFRRQEARS